MILSFITSHIHRVLYHLRKTQIGLFFHISLFHLPLLCKTVDTDITLERLLMLVRGSFWVLGPSLDRY